MIDRFRRRPGEPPAIYGHRGASSRAPENTMAAFALAVEEGADGVELDVRLCRTGEVIVVHDPDLARVGGGDSVPVAALSWRELQRRDVGGTLAPGQRVPLLDEVIDLLRAPGCDRVINVELKPDHVDRAGLARAVARVLLRRTVREREGMLLSTFDPRIAGFARMLLPRVPLAMLLEPLEVDALWGQLAALVLRAGGIHPPTRLCTRPRVARWRRRGWFVNAWTPNTAAHWRRLDAAGVDGLITDDPRGARTVIAGAD